MVAAILVFFFAKNVEYIMKSISKDGLFNAQRDNDMRENSSLAFCNFCSMVSAACSFVIFESCIRLGHHLEGEVQCQDLVGRICGVVYFW